MIILIISFLICLIGTYLLFKDNTSLFEVVGFSILLILGIGGFIPFIFFEFVNISYRYSAVEIFATTIVLFGFLLLKNQKIYLKHKVEFNLSGTLIFLIVLITIIRGYLLPMRGWDAYSLYDSRATMFVSGTKLSEMAVLSKYDEFNQLYYFSYPPLTSVLHAVDRATGTGHPMILYALLYSVFIIYVYLFIKPLLINNLFKLSLFTIATLNPIIFQHTKLAYTNLPALTFQFVALFYIIKFVGEKRYLYLLITALFIGFSNWTRSLEPLFISFFIAVLYIIFREKDGLFNKLLKILKYLVVSMVTWVVWNLFIKFTIGGLGETSPTVFGLVNKIFDALLLSNLLNVVFFIYNALFPIGLYVIMSIFILIYFLIKGFGSIRVKEKIILIILIATETMMVFGTLYFSTTFTWWDKIPDSFLRSNLILVPLTCVLCGYVLENIMVKK